MKKGFTMFLTCLMICVISVQSVFANAQAEASIVADKTELKAGDEVNVSFSLNDFQSVKKGINAYKGTLVYDEAIFETVVLSDFTCQNQWEELKYNPLNKEFVAIRKVGTKEGQAVVSLKLRVKKDAGAADTAVSIQNITASEGIEDIKIADATVELDIIKEQQNIPSKPSTPDQPSKPNDPSKPNNPSKPNDPTVPNDPTKPNNPSKPNDPIVPDNPSKPGNSITPINPNLPISPKPQNPPTISGPVLDKISDFIKSNNIIANTAAKENGEDLLETDQPHESITLPIGDAAASNAETTGIVNRSDIYTWLLIAVFIQAGIAVILYYKKEPKNRKISLFSVFIICFLLTEFIAGSAALASTLAQKGELNDDGVVNYADAGLLELHLIRSQKLSDDKLDNADMNNDGKLTVTDLSLLIQKLEGSLNYEVNMTDLTVENQFPNKNEEITLTFRATTSYGAKIEKVIINEQEYPVTKKADSDEYELKYKVGKTAGYQSVNINKLILSNNKKVTVNKAFEIDILKDQPRIENYRVEENIKDEKLTISFDLIDNDNSIVSTAFTVFDKDLTIISQTLEKGENRIEVPVTVGKEYTGLISLEYNLDSGKLESDDSHYHTSELEKQLQLLSDYDFKVSDIKTYKGNKETTEFENEDVVTIGFNSTNASKYEPEKVKINEKEYEVTKKDNRYYVELAKLDKIGETTFTIEEVILANGKSFTLDKDNSISVNVKKRKPTITDLTVLEAVESNELKVMFGYDDKDDAISSFKIIVMDADGAEMDSMIVTKDDIRDQGSVIKYLDTDITTKYQVKVLMSYNITGNPADNVSEEEVTKQEVEAKPRAEIKNINVDQHYPQKGDNVKLTFDIDSNKNDSITKIMVNNTNCIAVELDDGTYEVTLPVGENDGIYPFRATRITYSDGTTANVDGKASVDVLKVKPTVENFVQEDNTTDNKVKLKFDLKDDDESFVSGKAVLTYNGTTSELPLDSGKNELTFDVDPGKSYTLELKVTYDLDTNQLEGLPESDNKVNDEVLETRVIELVVDYNLTIQNIKTYNETGETKYFAKDEPVKISFESTNATSFKPIKAIINGKECVLTEKDGAYHLVVESHKTSGIKTAVIEKIILSNAREIECTTDNEVKVAVLKDVPKVEQFGYSENENGSVTTTFKVIDDEGSITAGKAIISNNGGVVKEQALTNGNNSVTFEPNGGSGYSLKVVADYDLDMNVLEENANQYDNITLFEADITLGARKIEMKDITDTALYQQSGDRVEEVTSLNEAALSDLSRYIAKVQMKQMPSFYTTVESYRIENNRLKLTLAYDDVVQYTASGKQDKLEIDYGDISSGTAQNMSLQALLAAVEADPTGNYSLTRDYDASILSTAQATLITSEFSGTLNGNGHTIYNLNKPLFNSLESATVENLNIEQANLNGASSRGMIANAAANSTIRNIHIKDLDMVSGANKTGGILGEGSATVIEQCSNIRFNLTTAGHIRVAAIVGNMSGGAIRNCYAEGNLTSTQNKDGNGISAILGTGEVSVVAVENNITKVQYTSNVSPRLNGDMVGLALNNNVSLKNNVSMSNGTNFYRVHGSAIHASSTNNYEMSESTLTSNASGTTVIQVAQADINGDFFKDQAGFDDTVWNLSDVSYDQPPMLKSSVTVEALSEADEMPVNNSLYIPDYTRIKKITAFTQEKEIAYHNINRLMPYYDAKFLVEDGLKIAKDHVLNTKVIKHILPFNNEGLVTYLTSDNHNCIERIKVVYDDQTTQEYPVSFKERKGNIAIYSIESLGIEYAFDKFIVAEASSIVSDMAAYIQGINYATTLDPLTAAADSRLYRDHFNETMKPQAQRIALQLLENEDDNALTINNEILNNKIKQDFIDSGRINQLLYGYNYYHRWYQFEIGDCKISDLMLFKGKAYSDAMTLSNLTDEVLRGNIATNVTANFYASNISKYTGKSDLRTYLNGIITNIGGYEDVNDWFTEYFGSRNDIREIPVKDHPEIGYRAWYQLTKRSNYVLPLVTVPKQSGYIMSGGMHFMVGALRTYDMNPMSAASRKEFINIMDTQVTNVSNFLNTMVGTFNPGIWNNVNIFMIDTRKIHTGWKELIPGVPDSRYKTYTMQGNGTSEPFHKNFNEALGIWCASNASAGYATGNDVFFVVGNGLTHFNTWSHELGHNIDGRIFLSGRGRRGKGEDYTDGNITQNDVWSTKGGAYNFNLTFNLGIESVATQNLTFNRINTRDKLENYYSGMQDTLDFLDYAEAKAFLQLTPQEQANLAVKVTQSGATTAWGNVTADQIAAMNLETVMDIWNNKLILRPAGQAAIEGNPPKVKAQAPMHMKRFG